MPINLKYFLFGILLLFCLIPSANSAPSIYPTGTTIYEPDKAWSGYTIFRLPENAGDVLIDMNGREVRRWPQTAGYPARILPGGFFMGSIGDLAPHQDLIALVQWDWDGNEVWRFDRLEQVENADGELVWASRQHHDWQREGNPVGYFTPGMEPMVDSGKTLILAHKKLMAPHITDKRIEDDYIVEVSWDGDVLWRWLASDHFDEFGFDVDAKAAIRKAVKYNEDTGAFDWLHINSASYVGPNKWYDEGDERFHPDNIIISGREANLIAIINRNGNVVWQMGPDFRTDDRHMAIGQIVGQHHPHIIPKGLPGEGNMMLFDNGGSAGYGPANPLAPDGVSTLTRFTSRIIEFNPVTYEMVWEYSPPGRANYQFFSRNVSSAQRLPNGNTLITEGAEGRLFEVTADNEIVWEYMMPYFEGDEYPIARTYRAYRVPYEWIPQLEKPEERAVVPPRIQDFRIAPE
ncbi:MAG: thioredoxin [Gammaproteobacteria bacterium]|nr:thioredoxin [Gammaproteobacteria bacterium]